MPDSFEEVICLWFEALSSKVSCNVNWNFKDFNAKACQYYFVLLDPYPY